MLMIREEEGRREPIRGFCTVSARAGKNGVVPSPGKSNTDTEVAKGCCIFDTDCPFPTLPCPELTAMIFSL
jgi:hypothetical protein